MPIITLINGNQYRYTYPISSLQVIQKIDFKLSRECIAVRVNGKLSDIEDIISNDSNLEFVTIHDNLGLEIIKNSCIYLLGYVVKELWPTSKMIGRKKCKSGFFFDIDLNFDLTKQDLTLLENKMLSCIDKGYKIKRKLIPLSKAKEFFLSTGEIYKSLILDKKFDKKNFVQIFYHQKYIDIFDGLHVPDIHFCRFFKLSKISKKFYNSHLGKITLQRVHGVLYFNDFNSPFSNKYLNKSKEIKKYDHRNFASQLDLYHIQENAPGMIFWHENGLIIFQELKNFIRKKLKQYKYKEVKTPIMIDRSLWKKTGHWDNYYEHIFTTISEDREYCIKPMNCPGHIQIFNHNLKSYKDLPVRIAEFGSCHRNEYSGSLHGLMRIREFVQDDAHIFCSESQIYSELNHCIEMMYDVYNTFGFKNILINLSTRPKKRIGQDSQWDVAENILSTVLKENNIEFQSQPYDGAFYGPKIELTLLDSLSRKWQCGTIQLDFSLPKLLGARYINNINKYQTPVVIHRAILGSIERFIGLLTEEYLGFFPTWLAPIQVVLMGITYDQNSYIISLEKKLVYENIRVKTDLRNETIGSKIRLYTLYRIPYMLICGKLEMDQGTVSIRTYKGKEFKNYDISVFLKKLKHEIYNCSFLQMEE